MRKLTVLCVLALLVSPLSAWGQSNPFPVTNTVVLQNAAAATGNGAVIDTSRAAITTIQASGTFTATGTFQGTVDGTNFATLTCYTPASASATTFTAAGLWYCRTQGLTGVRVPITWTSGTSVTVVAHTTSGTALPADAPISIAPPAGFTITSGATGTGTQIKCSQTTAPTCSSACGSTGTPLVAGCDSAGVVTLGTGTMSASPVVTFDGTWSNTPSCVATMSTQTGTLEVIKAVATTTTLTTTLTGTAIAGDKYQYVCIGR